MKMTDDQYNALLETAFSPIVPDVWEGVYTGEDLDTYITFFYENQPAMFANNRPTVLLRNTTVVLWVRNGEDAFAMRDALRRAILSFEMTVPTEQVATDNGWQQYIFTFTYSSGYPG